MHDIRWFAPNRFCSLPVPRLRQAGLKIATEGDQPAALVYAADGVSVVEAFRFARRHQKPLAIYLWDLPPWQLGAGRPNQVVVFGGRLLKVPRLWRAYPERNGYYSRLRYVAQRAAAVWAPSAASTADVRTHFGVHCEEVPFCFDSDRFNREAGWQDPHGVPDVLAISRLVPHKNHLAVVRAVAQLPHRATLRIIGNGPEAVQLERVARAGRVELTLITEWQSDQQILDAYRRASVVVSLSRFEGLGLTPLEAAALGIPVVLSDIPPHREFADHGMQLVPLDDAVTAARALDMALRGDRVSESARQSISELTIEACAARLLQRFAALLSQS